MQTLNWLHNFYILTPYSYTHNNLNYKKMSIVLEIGALDWSMQDVAIKSRRRINENEICILTIIKGRDH